MPQLMGPRAQVVLGATGGGTGPLSIDGVVPPALVGPGGLAIIDSAQCRWALVAEGDAFTPAIAPVVGGIRVAGSRTAGEAPTDAHAYDIDAALTVGKGRRLLWRTFADRAGGAPR